MWSNNKKNGFGLFYYHTGAVYEGNFVDDIREGQGKLTFMANSAVEEGYEGTWVNDEWHGYGIYRYRKEEGKIHYIYSYSDVFQKFGDVLIRCPGTVYEGDWVHGVREGQGKITFKDGSFYRGDMQKNQMWGHGIFVGMRNSKLNVFFSFYDF